MLIGAGTGGEDGPVTVNLGMTEQTIEGFGINDTWGKQFDSSVTSQLFSTDKGIGLSILRIGMSDGGGDYNTFESANISAAQGAGAKIIGSTWSPPASCKTNNNTQQGGSLVDSTTC